MTIAFSPALMWREMSSRSGRPITPPAYAPLTLTAAELSGRSSHFEAHAAFRRVHLGRNSVKRPRNGSAAATGTQRLSGDWRPAETNGGTATGFGSRVYNDRLSQIGFVPGSIRMGRSDALRLKDNQHRLQRLQIEREVHLIRVPVRSKGIEATLVAHGIPAFRFTRGRGAELELPRLALGGSGCTPGTRLARPSGDATRATSRRFRPKEPPASAERPHWPKPAAIRAEVGFCGNRNEWPPAGLVRQRANPGVAGFSPQMAVRNEAIAVASRPTVADFDGKYP